MQLTKTEEQLMQHLWELKRSFMKDLIDSYTDPKPAPTTIATLLKRMSDKGFVGFKVYGKSREYYPLIAKADYFSNHVDGLIKNFFNDSASQFASFFTQRTNFTAEELEGLKKIIEQEIKRKKK